MEGRCPKCYSTKIVNNIGMITEHGHPGHPEPVGQFPVGIISPITGAFTQLKVDVCKKCGYMVRCHL